VVKDGPVHEVVKTGEQVDLEVPAHAELVLEGWVDPDERRREGPFGDHTGFYSLADEYPVFHVTAVTHRKDAIYPTTIVGRPPMEDCYMGYAIERMFLPLMRKMLPEVVDYHMPFEGGFHNLMIVAIDKRYPQHGRRVMHGIWGLGIEGT
jgi:4-hydroxy-3-polyprenylbenzoate decarboxylase